jgi:formylglycine-generating enzyme required for sulfatase activity
MEGYSLVEPDRDWPADGVARLARGCSFPEGNSPFGVCDLAGNIGEWVEPASGDRVPVYKGGTWMDPDPWTFRIATRGWMSLDREVTSVGFYLTGFRCARSAGS